MQPSTKCGAQSTPHSVRFNTEQYLVSSVQDPGCAPRAGLDGYRKSRPPRHWDSISGPSSPYRVAIPTEVPRPSTNAYLCITDKCTVCYSTDGTMNIYVQQSARSYKQSNCTLGDCRYGSGLRTPDCRLEVSVHAKGSAAGLLHPASQLFSLDLHETLSR